MSRDRWLSARDPDTVRSLTPATPSCRKAYLLGFAYCRRIVHLIDSQDWRRAVERVELHADNRDPRLVPDLIAGCVADDARGSAGRCRQRLAVAAAEVLCRRSPSLRDIGCLAAEAVAYAALGDHGFHVPGRAEARLDSAWQAAFEAERAVQADLVRCILGDPWRPRINRAPLRSSVMRAAATLAHKIYNERLFGEMPLLADALERAGCHDEQVLGHLRGPGPHALGCHVLDALTGRAGPVAGSAAGSLAATSEPLPYRRICVG